MAASESDLLTADDLVKPARHLSLKVLIELGQMLQQPKTGNWEIVAEELGYCHEDMKHFSAVASVQQQANPGEIMLRHWVEKSDGCTMFVLCNTLDNIGRHDCTLYLKNQIYRRVVCMDLMVCVKDESSNRVEHKNVRTKTESTLLDSLSTILEHPIQDRYRLLDPGISWTSTKAKEFKGLQLMLLKCNRSMEQDPTIDSSDSHDDPVGGRGNEHFSEENFAASGLMFANSRNSHVGPSDRTFASPSEEDTNSVLSRSQIFSREAKSRHGQRFRQRSDASRNGISSSNVHQRKDRSQNADSQIQTSRNQDQYAHHFMNNGAVHPHNNLNVSSYNGSVTMTENLNVYKPEHCATPLTVFSPDNNADVSWNASFHFPETEKSLNVSDEDMTDSEYKHCFSDMEDDGYSFEHKCSEDFTDGSFETPEYQDGGEDLKCLDDSITLVKELYQRQFEDNAYKKSFPACENHIDGSLTFLKQPLNAKGNMQSFSAQKRQQPVEKQRISDEQSEAKNIRAYLLSLQTDLIKQETIKEKVIENNLIVNTNSNSMKQGVKYETEMLNEKNWERPNYLDLSNSEQCSFQGLSNKRKCTVSEESPVLAKDVERLYKPEDMRNLPHSHVTQCTKQAYEKLEHQDPPVERYAYDVSCEFEDHANDLPVIADLFTPVEENIELKDFTMSSGLGFQRSSQRDTYKTESVTSRPSSQHVHFDTPFQRDTVHSSASFQRREHVDIIENVVKPALPPRNRSRNALSACEQHVTFKYVTAGVSRRTSVDNSLVNDALFMHYHEILSGTVGWCPRETDYTIHKTMTQAVDKDGYYILWYSRTKKNLVLTVSYAGQAVHFRIHTKVFSRKLHYYTYVNEGPFDDLMILLQHYQMHGLRVPNTEQRGGNSGGTLFMRYPVIVKYERRVPKSE